MAKKEETYGYKGWLNSDSFTKKSVCCNGLWNNSTDFCYDYISGDVNYI